MKLHLTQSDNHNLITGYGDGYIEVNKKRYEQPIIIMPESLTLDWLTKNIETLSDTDFNQLLTLKPEVVLLGTGRQHHFIHPKLTAPLVKQHIAVECMSTDAACRTYNILMSEGRSVAAALFLK